MNPKGKVLDYDSDVISPAASTHQYARKLVARQSQGTQLVARQPLGTLSPPQPFRSSADLGVAESSNVPLAVFGQRVESAADPSPSSSRQITKLHSVHHQPSLHQMDLANSASTFSAYHQPLSPNQKHLNPYFNAMNDLDNAASDPRESFDAFQGESGGNYGGQHSNQKAASGRDQSHDETKVYTDVNAGGAKSYQDYMTAGDLESKKYLSGKYGDVEDAGSGHYEGQIPVHFGFQVEHPRLQYPSKSSHHSDYHIPTKSAADYHIPSKSVGDYHHIPSKSGDYQFPKSGDYQFPKSGDFHIPKSGGKIKIPKIPNKVSPSKYIPSVEDVDGEPESDFKHIKIKKYSTKNDELPIPSTYNARYTDELPNQSRHNFKYVNSVSTSSGSVDPHHSLEQQRAASAPEHHILPHQQLMKLAKKSPNSSQQYQQNQDQVEQQSRQLHQQYQQNQQQIGQQLHQQYQQSQQGQASQKYYQYVKPQMERKSGSQTPLVIYV
uniref:Uncharacterized protein n=1 Tax=Cacopsylla melanoneura TaxID=428564 RepID=A0A8D8RB75_9HEMI